MDCPLCGVALAERGFFCKACAGQVRCKSCRELLEPTAIACVECGTRIGESNRQPMSLPELAVSSVQQPHRNTLSYEETRNNRTFHASLTDTAIQGLGGVLGDFFVQRGTARVPSQAPSSLLKRDLSLPSPPTIALTPENGNSTSVPDGSNPAGPNGTGLAGITRIFSLNGETLELADNRLKAKTLADYLKRLTYLFLYAHELHGHSSVSSEQLKEVLRANKAWDRYGNAGRWLAKRIGLANDGDDRIKLTTKGREDASRM